MPLYNDLGFYYTPHMATPSYYSSPFLGTAGRSSALGLGLLPVPRLLPSRVTSSYSALLPSIPESGYAAARCALPAMDRSTSPRALPRYMAPKPLHINTCDIDVSSARLGRERRERPERPLIAAGGEPSRQATIKRGRTVVRLHTKKQKENPDLDAVGRRRMTPGEKLVQKFLIVDKAEEEAKAARRKRLEELEERERVNAEVSKLQALAAKKSADDVENDTTANKGTFGDDSSTLPSPHNFPTIQGLTENAALDILLSVSEDDDKVQDGEMGRKSSTGTVKKRKVKEKSGTVKAGKKKNKQNDAVERSQSEDSPATGDETVEKCTLLRRNTIRFRRNSSDVEGFPDIESIPNSRKSSFDLAATSRRSSFDQSPSSRRSSIDSTGDEIPLASEKKSTVKRKKGPKHKFVADVSIENSSAEPRSPKFVIDEVKVEHSPASPCGVPKKFRYEVIVEDIEEESKSSRRGKIGKENITNSAKKKGKSRPGKSLADLNDNILSKSDAVSMKASKTKVPEKETISKSFQSPQPEAVTKMESSGASSESKNTSKVNKEERERKELLRNVAPKTIKEEIICQTTTEKCNTLDENEKNVGKFPLTNKKEKAGLLKDKKVVVSKIDGTKIDKQLIEKTKAAKRQPDPPSEPISNAESGIQKSESGINFWEVLNRSDESEVNQFETSNSVSKMFSPRDSKEKSKNTKVKPNVQIQTPHKMNEEKNSDLTDTKKKPLISNNVDKFGARKMNILTKPSEEKTSKPKGVGKKTSEVPYETGKTVSINNKTTNCTSLSSEAMESTEKPQQRATKQNTELKVTQPMQNAETKDVTSTLQHSQSGNLNEIRSSTNKIVEGTTSTALKVQVVAENKTDPNMKTFGKVPHVESQRKGVQVPSSTSLIPELKNEDMKQKSNVIQIDNLTSAEHSKDIRENLSTAQKNSKQVPDRSVRPVEKDGREIKMSTGKAKDIFQVEKYSGEPITPDNTPIKSLSKTHENEKVAVVPTSPSRDKVIDKMSVETPHLEGNNFDQKSLVAAEELSQNSLVKNTLEEKLVKSPAVIESGVPRQNRKEMAAPCSESVTSECMKNLKKGESKQDKCGDKLNDTARLNLTELKTKENSGGVQPPGGYLKCDLRKDVKQGEKQNVLGVKKGITPMKKDESQSKLTLIELTSNKSKEKEQVSSESSQKTSKYPENNRDKLMSVESKDGKSEPKKQQKNKQESLSQLPRQEAKKPRPDGNICISDKDEKKISIVKKNLQHINKESEGNEKDLALKAPKSQLERKEDIKLSSSETKVNKIAPPKTTEDIGGGPSTEDKASNFTALKRKEFKRNKPTSLEKVENTASEGNPILISVAKKELTAKKNKVPSIPLQKATTGKDELKEPKKTLDVKAKVSNVTLLETAKATGGALTVASSGTSTATATATATASPANAVSASSPESGSDADSEDSSSEDEGLTTPRASGSSSSRSSSDSGFDSRPSSVPVPSTASSEASSREGGAQSLALSCPSLDPYSEDAGLLGTRAAGASGRTTPPASSLPRFRKYTVDDFQFLKLLGKGSFGKVLLAELRGTDRHYAVKCLKKDVVLEDDDVECTLIERKVLALGTKHPYLCHLFCTFQTQSHLLFVMEYLNGGDLMFHIQQSGRFSEPRARFYGAEIVSGLKFLHKKGIVYRDLKLDNILLDYEGHVRIADFGMCKLQIFLDRTADTFCGTPDYMAPEIIKGLKYNQCVDWWSFGVLVFEMLVGVSPFTGCDEDELFWTICNEQPQYPRFLSCEAHSLLTSLLEKDAMKRLGTPGNPKGDVPDHVFFRPIDWNALESRELVPPFRPRVKHPLDVQYFDKAFTAERAELTPVDASILQSMDQAQFQGFSYTNPNATD